MKVLDKYKHIRKLEIKAKVLAENIASGLYVSAFKGNGIDFNYSRPYIDGDDVKHLDNRLSARNDELYVKTFIEDREIDVLLLVDISASMNSQYLNTSKYDTLTEICSIISGAAYLNGDKVGMVMFSNKIEKVIMPNRHHNSLTEILNSLVTFRNIPLPTDINNALKYVSTLFSRKALVFLVSDFIDDNYTNELKIASQKYDIVLICINDIDYSNLKDGMISCKDSESNTYHTIDLATSDKANLYLAAAQNNAKVCNIDVISLSVGDSFLSLFIKLMNERSGKYC